MPSSQAGRKSAGYTLTLLEEGAQKRSGTLHSKTGVGSGQRGEVEEIPRTRHHKVLGARHEEEIGTCGHGISYVTATVGYETTIFLKKTRGGE